MAKKKILLLADDIRLHSGIGTMSKEFVLGTIDKYDWCQLAGAVNHPEKGKIIDMSQEIKQQGGPADAYCKIYPTTGYGSPEEVRQMMQLERPDAILHFTDPRFWGWLYNMEHEIRQHIPIMYYNIWDDLPYPHWNENAYESCDLLMAISKQTYNINKHVCQRKPRTNWDLKYVQHGVDERKFFPVDENEESFINFKKELYKNKEYDFVLFFNSRNIRRKGISDLMMGFKEFLNTIPKEKADKCALLLHTDPVDDNGTDLPAVASMLCPNTNIIFSNQKIPFQTLNLMYNSADITCNPSSAEGFGISHMESMMAGKPTICSVIGGLQDQMGFKVDGRDITVDDFTEENGSNSKGRLSKEHGDWTYPLWTNMSLQGSPPTPYIYDSRPRIEDITKAIEYWYNTPKSERVTRGKVGREWAIKNKFTAKGMSDAMADAIAGCLKNWKPRERFTLIDTNKEKTIYPTGVLV